MTARNAAAVLLAIAVVAGVAGCGSAAPDDSPGATAPGAPSSTPSDRAPESTAPPTAGGPFTTVPPRVGSPRPGKPTPTGEIVITGHVTDGVEAGCQVIRTLSGPTYSLMLTPDLKRRIELASDPVTLRGRLRPGLINTCQQGTPFEVTAIVPA